MKALIELAKNIVQKPSDSKHLISDFVQSHTFPIVNEQRATFFYWDEDFVDDVQLMHWISGLESSQSFRRLPKSNAFWLTIDLPKAARVEYKLCVTKGGNRYWMRDPLNAERAFDPFGSNSVCAMPGYADPEWSRTDPRTQGGRLESFMVGPGSYDDEREIQVYLPREYRPEKSYPLLICHDGRDYKRFSNIITVLDNLIFRHEVMPIIVAFTNGVQRNIEYGANPQQADFIAKDVLPALEKKYKLSPGPQNRGLMGASFGGVTSLYTAWKNPGIFHKMLLQSGSFAFTDIGEHGRGELWDSVVEFVNAIREDPSNIKGRMFISCGTFESLIYYNRSLAPVLRKNGVDLRYVESQDGHNWINWRDRLREGLTWLFPGHLWMYYE
jgi:enterochelin esterase family protein